MNGRLRSGSAERVGLSFLQTSLCALPLPRLEPEAVSAWVHLFGAHSQELWRVSIFWLLSSNHATGFNPFIALERERSPPKANTLAKPIFLPYKMHCLFRMLLETGS